MYHEVVYITYTVLYSLLKSYDISVTIIFFFFFDSWFMMISADSVKCSLEKKDYQWKATYISSCFVIFLSFSKALVFSYLLFCTCTKQSTQYILQN